MKRAWPDPYTLEWHQCWAGTSDVSNTPQIGILVGEYRIKVYYLGTGTQEPDEWPGGGEPDHEAMRLEVLRTLFAQINPIPAGGQKE